MTILRLAPVGATCLLSALLALPGPRAEAPALQEEIQVVLVQLPLIATNRQGDAVTDLTAGEITVEEDGHPIPVAYLDRLRRTPSPAVESAPTRLFVEAPGGWPQPESSATGRPEYVVFFIDNRNDDLLEREKTTARLVQFAETGLRPWARAAVMSYDGTAHLDLPFTTDRAALTSALSQARSRVGGPLVNLQSEMRQLLTQYDECVLPGQSTMMRSADEQCLRDITRMYVEQQRPSVEGFLDALTDTVQFLAGLRGRKTVYALSHGVAVDPRPVVTEAVRSVLGNAVQVTGIQLDLGAGDAPAIQRDRLLELAVRHRVSLSFIDRMRAPTMDTGASSGRLMYPGTAPARVAYAAAQDDLREMAATTGGIFVAQADVSAALAKVRDLLEAGYELGYTLEQIPTKDRLSRIKVKTTRRGVNLTYSRGVSADAGPSGIDTLHGRIVIEPAAKAPGAEAVGTQYSFTIQADPKQLGYTEQGGEMAANLTLHVIVEDAKGRERVGDYHLIEHAYPLDLWRAGEVEPVTIRGWIELPPGSYTLRAVFRNTVGGQSGEVSRSLTAK